MAELLHAIRINAAPEAVMAALTTREGLSSWWTADCAAQPQLGHVNVFRFNRGAIEFRFRVDEQRPDGLQWTCVEGERVPQEWLGTRLRIALDDTGQGVLVNLCHSGWWSTAGALPTCNTTWGELMYRLRDSVEGRGRGPLFPG